MDLSKFKTSDWLKVGGAIAFFIFGFFSWVTVDGLGTIGLSSGGGNVFDFFWTGTLPWILIMATGVVTVLLVLEILKPGNLPLPLIMLAASALAALLLVIRLIFNPLEGKDILEAAGFNVGRGFGMIACAVAGVVVFAGAFLGFKESGGDIHDLKDVDKLKSQFGMTAKTDSGTTPPPPPPPSPGGTPPPPAL